MRWYAWCLMLVGAAMIGCEKPDETIPAVTPSSGTTDAAEHEEGDHGEDGHEHAEGEEDSAATGTDSAVRFVADTSLKVPGMMCPYACYPSVEKTLAKVPGVEGVQLAEQPEGTAEGEIKKRVVELKINDSFDPQAAVAALGDIDYEAEVLN